MPDHPLTRPLHRSVIHADLDEFFAAVEVLDRPELAGRPVVVGADPKRGKGRGVVSTASYAARAYGIHSAMPISEAWRRCPHAVFLPVRPRRYLEVSRRVMAIFARFTPEVEPLSLDEAFLDVTGSRRLFGDGAACARALVEAVWKEEGLHLSVGVATSKSVAKVASDLEKPRGFVVVPPGEEAAFLAPLPVGRLWGVGPRSREVLERLGARRIGDLPRLGRPVLESHLGAAAARRLLDLAEGRDPRPVAPREEVRSIGHEITFEEDTADADELRRTLLHLSDRVGRRARRLGVRGRTVHLKLRWDDFRTVTRDHSHEPATAATAEIFRRALALLDRVHPQASRGRRVRLIGVALTHLVPEGTAVQPDLFGETEREEREEWLDRAADRVRERFGEGAIFRAALLGRRGTSQPDGSRGRPID